MDYPFESLDPESFQQFCQALLAVEVPSLQCFPVAQADGGRDAIAYTQSSGPALEFVMYQVKFVRRPQAEQDPQKWLVNILEEEAPKVAKQILNGAKRFYLLTNVAGTAHPESGSIDKARRILASTLSIPAEVWWRDDLNRRLDNAPNLKWAFPQLMTGPDLMKTLIESGLTEEKERRTSAIRAFVSDQYAADEEVKFKQVELQNRLLDLFIDVPIVPPGHPASRRQASWYSHFRFAALKAAQRDAEMRERAAKSGILVDDSYPHPERPQMGAATMLLDAVVQDHIPTVVLEGAPGQGKSTITQYVAQVHRMRLLENHAALESIPEFHRIAPVRLPFKVDLRDFSSWLLRRDPFSGKSEAAAGPDGWQKSLESFLAALVRHHSGGSPFDIADLHAVARTSAIMILLDGLDEVAEISRREDVVQEIVRGTRRLREVAVSIQVVVTSRPAAFANSPGLPDDVFPYFQLDSLTRPLINEYADKWLHARKLPGREQSEVKHILSDKLNQPHLRDLARNPMQLAILLSLIHTRGSSLPDKRTALYDAYMELFFNREAEKSEIIREHRDLIIDIHRFVAWTLHVEAEASGGNGSITRDRFHALLETYLTREGHNPALAETMFRGVVERVVAIVSRVEGTYEFEVQPLREYFAARYLYETAPYSPPGNEKGGTKPDRFDALARDFYWLNVTRFYAGCYSKGELSSLVDRLQELVRDKGYSRIAHPRLLAATLLGDWVFAQHPRSMKDVVALVLDGIGLRFLVSSVRRRIHGSTPLILPSKSGRDELISHAIKLLHGSVPRDFALDLIDVLRANATNEELLALWETQSNSDRGSERTKWLGYGARMGTLARVSLEKAVNFMADEAPGIERLEALVGARRWDVLESTETLFAAAVDAILDVDVSTFGRGRGARSVLERFALAMTPMRFAWSLYFPDPAPLVEVWRRRGPSGWVLDDIEDDGPPYAAVEQCKRLTQVIIEQSQIPARTWATELEPWDRVVEIVRKDWGNRWGAIQLANYAAGIRNTAETSREYSELFDESKSLCRRARYARLRAGTASWWLRQRSSASSDSQLPLWACLLLTWGSASTLSQLSSEIDAVLKGMEPVEWRRLFGSVESAIGITGKSSGERMVRLATNSLPSSLGERCIAALALRADAATKRELFERYFLNSVSTDLQVLQVIQSAAIDAIAAGRNLKQALELIRRSYSVGVISDDFEHETFERRSGTELSLEIAKKVTDAPNDYPSFLVAGSERRYQGEVAKEIVQVGKIADRDGWTFS